MQRLTETAMFNSCLTPVTNFPDSIYPATMTESLKVRKFGGSLGIILPKNVADSLALQEGDELFVSATTEGISISPYDPDFAAALDDAREFMRTHREAFRELAK